ncbi:GCN5 family acetyltransferase [Pedobacter lusitanus]|uniref:GCN5 family acetyltransferase n=1 Tax=Pedobacter lusitanus TaxID=1503925 RepID=A0A0D0GWL0_9SPHI|nr:GNAT family N-acetyltransferase [Pedobacter lusitanus]KIO78796.1 GCN5 family acetyltransferase [Pedobacter lusitanus]
MPLYFRDLKIEDAEAVTRLSDQLGYPATKAETELRVNSLLLHPDHCIIVAVIGETITGWIHAFYTIRLEADPFVEIGGLVVDENYRNQQIGEKLVEQVKEWALNKDVKKLRVRCQTKRTASHHFYQKTGFIQTKEQKVFDLNIAD